MRLLRTTAWTRGREGQRHQTVAAKGRIRARMPAFDLRIANPEPLERGHWHKPPRRVSRRT